METCDACWHETPKSKPRASKFTWRTANRSVELAHGLGLFLYEIDRPMRFIKFLRKKERKKPRESEFPVALRWKPVCFVVESIVLRLFKKRRTTPIFWVFFVRLAGILMKNSFFIKVTPDTTRAPEGAPIIYFAPETLGCS